MSSKAEKVVNFAKICMDCRKYYQNFKIDLNLYYDKEGKSIIKTQDLYEKFSFICKKCGLLNILNFTELCDKETVLYLRKQDEDIFN